MSTFAENIADFAPIDTIDRLELYSADSYKPQAIIENKPGQQGSLRVYYQMALDFGGIGPSAAEKALKVFAEHADDAKQNPGKHPNIDRLFQIIDSGEIYSVKSVPKV